MDPQVRANLLESIEANRLIILIGAGLSMAAPSSIPGAASVAATCFDDYTAMADPEFDPRLRYDLEGIADYFAQRDRLKTIFIDRLVPWQLFVRPPNRGHLAIADLLITRAAAGALSANYDILIERAAWTYGARFIGSLDGDEANIHSGTHSPLLKFHGCESRDRDQTVWTKSQLDGTVIARRIAKSTAWMAANLREKDLLVVGFWSDWSYFNGILGTALAGVSPASVTLVDLAAAPELQAKAPDLWRLAHRDGIAFTHIQESGADVLDELRRFFSKGFLRRMLRSGIPQLEIELNRACDPGLLTIDDFDSESLYSLRQDAEGTPATRPATRREPAHSEALGYFHLILRHAGAHQMPDGYELKGRRIRVINGNGAILSRLKERFLEAPTVSSSVDIVAAVGAVDLGVPSNVVRSGRSGDIVRPGTSGVWLDFSSARSTLGV